MVRKNKEYAIHKHSKKEWSITFIFGQDKMAENWRDNLGPIYKTLNDAIKQIPKNVTKLVLASPRSKNIKLPDWIKELEVYGSSGSTFNSFPKNLRKIVFWKCEGLFPKDFSSLKHFKEFEAYEVRKLPKNFPESTKKINFQHLRTAPKNSILSLPSNLVELSLGDIDNSKSKPFRFPDLSKSPKLKYIFSPESLSHWPTKISKIKLDMYSENVPEAWKKMLIR